VNYQQEQTKIANGNYQQERIPIARTDGNQQKSLIRIKQKNKKKRTLEYGDKKKQNTKKQRKPTKLLCPKTEDLKKEVDFSKETKIKQI
jgi:hypothetical protein